MGKNLEQLYQMSFESVYPLYVQKIERKGRTIAELDEVLTWLTGWSEPSQMTGSLGELLENLQLNPHSTFITGVVCGRIFKSLSFKKFAIWISWLMSLLKVKN